MNHLKSPIVTILLFYITASYASVHKHPLSVTNFEKSHYGNLDSSTKNPFMKELPLTVIKSKTDNQEAPLIFFISGDRGWYSFNQLICEKFAEIGMPVVGLDAKKYFWDKKVPQETAQDVAKTLYSYCHSFNKKKIILIGYSMGAEVMPFIYGYLPKDLQAMTENIVLLSPTGSTDFEVHLSDLLGFGSSNNTYDVVKELEILSKDKPVVVITGIEEKTQLPPKLTNTQIKFELLAGNHHYNNDTPKIFNTIFKNLNYAKTK
uniref:AcvB/VirJ family lysyl-phosphatidylglycerol hydrolase n=1 Tax=Mariniflexile sp. TaxID=1979402 RepID=UPI004047AA6D